MKCPNCQNPMHYTQTAFIEIGEYSDDKYEYEADVRCYACNNCRTEIAMIESPNQEVV
jgi:hypothetical protein